MSTLSAAQPLNDIVDDDALHNSHQSQGHCPVCSQPLQIGAIFPAPYVDRRISNAVIHCIHFGKGCIWTGTVNELTKKNGHLKQCGFGLYTCKYCKEKIVRNQMVRHQNEECKSQYISCPFFSYGCNFRCRLREMEQHCQLNELQHVKLKLDFLETQSFIPEMVRMKGMSGYNNDYLDSNGKYYLVTNHGNKKGHSANKSITYTKNGGYNLVFNKKEQIWQLRSLYKGLIAYAIPSMKRKSEATKTFNDRQNLNEFMGDNCVWSVYYKQGVKDSLMIDKNVSIESVQLSENVLKWNTNEETDTEEIVGEYDGYFGGYAAGEGEGVVVVAANQQMENGKRREKKQRQLSWTEFIFGGEMSSALERRKSVTKKLEIIGFVALTGIAVYVIWGKVRKSYELPAVPLLQSASASNTILVPNPV